MAESNNIKDYPTVGLLFPSNYLQGDDLRGREFVVVIDTIEPRAGVKDSSGQEAKKVVVSLKHIDGRPVKKKWIMNKTNALRIASLYGNKVHDWIGKPIIMGTERGTWFGKTQDALRVMERRPADFRPSPRSSIPQDNKSIEDCEAPATTSENPLDIINRFSIDIATVKTAGALTPIFERVRSSALSRDDKQYLIGKIEERSVELFDRGPVSVGEDDVGATQPPSQDEIQF